MQNHVFEWPRTQAVAPCIHTGCIGFNHFEILCRLPTKSPLRQRTKTMEAITLVGIQSHLAKQFRQLSRCLTANQVHLEKAILTVRKARCERQISARGCRNRRNT